MIFRPLPTLLIVTFLNRSVAVSVFLHQLNSVNTSKQNVLELQDSESNKKSQSLRVLVKESAPFSFQISNESYGGIEVQFVKTMAKEMNVGIKFFSSNDSSQLNDIEGLRYIVL